MNFAQINLVLAELQAGPHWHLQQVIQTDFSHLYLQFNNAGKTINILVALNSPHVRIHEAEPPAGSAKGRQNRFAELLRARLKGCRLVAMYQWQNQRIVVMEFHCPEGPLRLICRLWNNAANAILCQADGQIIDCVSRRMSRGEHSGGRWQFPDNPGRQGQRIPQDIPEYPAGPDRPFNRWLHGHFLHLETLEAQEKLASEFRRLWNNAWVKARRRLESLEDRARHARNSEQLRIQADHVNAMIGRIPRGASTLEVQDWADPDKILVIPLDPALGPRENALRYYQKYQKAREGLTWLEEDIRKAGSHLARLESLQQAFGQSPDHQAALGVWAELARLAGLDSPRESSESPDFAGARFVIQGCLVQVGRNASESDQILRHQARGNDWWFHVRDFPGGHVFVRLAKGQALTEQVLLGAAHLACWYSKGREEKELDLYYTQVKYLRRAKNGPAGTVLPTQERNIHLRVEQARLDQVLGNS